MDERASARFVAETHRQVSYSSAVNCRGGFSSFTCVFQPYQICQQQFKKKKRVSSNSYSTFRPSFQLNLMDLILVLLIIK